MGLPGRRVGGRGRPALAVLLACLDVLHLAARGVPLHAELLHPQVLVARAGVQLEGECWGRPLSAWPQKALLPGPGVGAQSPARWGRGSAGGHGGAGAPRGARCPHPAPTSRLQSDRLRELARHGLVARPHAEIHVLHVKLQPCGHGGVTNGARRGVTPRPHPQHHHPNLWASPSSHPKAPLGLDPAPCPHRPGCTRCP